MKKMFLSALAVAALAFVGCTEDATNDLAQNGGAAVELHEITFEAEIEQPSRTSLVDPGTGTSYVCWDANDEIAIITEDGNVYKATVSGEAGKPWATFTATISGTPVAAVYPYSFANSNGPSITYDSDVATSKIGLLFPNFQIHKTGSVFSNNINAMVAVADENTNGTIFKFKSVMGALELKFTGSQKVNGITVKTQNKDVKVSGVGYVTIGDNGNNTLAMATDMTAQSYVNLEVPEAVTLSGTATSFYVLVPAGTYEALQIGVMTEDGSYVRTATQAHTVRAGEIKPINCGNLDTMIDEGAATNLSADGYANCYVVVPNGSVKTYSFDIKLVDGTIPTNAHINKSYSSVENSEEALAPHMAQILWTEDTGVAYDIQFDKVNGKVYFKNNGAALGNARIMLICDPFAVAATPKALNTGKTDNESTTINEAYVLDFNAKAIHIKRAEQTFIWGWHIWSTPSTPAVGIVVDGNNVKDNDTAAQVATRGKINLMDRNLGATWTATTVSEVNGMVAQNASDAIGLFYQAGNVSPLTRPTNHDDNTTNWVWARAKYQYGFTQYAMNWTHSSSIKTTVDETLQFPYYRYGNSYTPTDNYTGSTARNSWLKKDFRIGGTKGSGDANIPILWSNNFKTNYDPCPPGWKIPHQGNLYQWVEGATKTIADVGKGAVNKLFVHDATYGQYITYNGVDAFFTPATGYLGGGSRGSIQHGYFWGSPYASSTYTSTTTDGVTTVTAIYNSAVKAITNNNPQSNGSDTIWPQAGTGFQVRCVKGN